jgi:hypothetical protein
VSQKICDFLGFFFIFGLFSLNSKFATKVFFFQNMFHKMVKIGPSKNHLVQVMELLIFSKKLGFSEGFCCRVMPKA